MPNVTGAVWLMCEVMLQTMRNSILIVAFAFLGIGNSTGQCQGGSQPLKFYIVSGEKSSGKHFVENIPNTPKTGFISTQPELVLTALQDVKRINKGAWEAWT